jgi:hypothetical protein
MTDYCLPSCEEHPQQLDRLSHINVFASICWILLVLGFAIWMIVNHNLPSIRIRNVSLALCSTALLSVYWLVYILAYPLKAFYSCAMEFWMMCLVLSSGIALFQTNNIQLLSMATLQQRFVRNDSLFPRSERNVRGIRSLKRRWAELSLARQTGIGIGIGTIFQVFVGSEDMATSLYC